MNVFVGHNHQPFAYVSIMEASGKDYQLFVIFELLEGASLSVYVCVSVCLSMSVCPWEKYSCLCVTLNKTIVI